MCDTYFRRIIWLALWYTLPIQTLFSVFINEDEQYQEIDSNNSHELAIANYRCANTFHSGGNIINNSLDLLCKKTVFSMIFYVISM